MKCSHWKKKRFKYKRNIVQRQNIWQEQTRLNIKPSKLNLSPSRFFFLCGLAWKRRMAGSIVLRQFLAIYASLSAFNVMANCLNDEHRIALFFIDMFGGADYLDPAAYLANSTTA